MTEGIQCHLAESHFSFKPQPPLRQKACLREEQLTQVLTEGGIMCFGQIGLETGQERQRPSGDQHHGERTTCGARGRRTGGPRYSGFMNILIHNGKKRKTRKKHARFFVLQLTETSFAKFKMCGTEKNQVLDLLDLEAVKWSKPTLCTNSSSYVGAGGVFAWLSVVSLDS